MSLKKKFIFNTAIISASKIIENLIAFLIIILISRELGSVGLGQYSFLFSFVGLFFIFSDWGLSAMMIKDLSKDFSKVNKYVSNIINLKFILTFISFIVYFFVLFFINQDELFWSLVVVGLITYLNIFDSFYNILIIKTKGISIAIAFFLERIIALLGGFFVLYYFKSLFLFVIILLISNTIRTILMFLFSKKYFKYKLTLDLNFLLSLIRKGFPFVLISTFSLVYVRMDTVMLGFMKTYEVVGFYNAGYKLIDVLCVIPALLLTFGFPMLSRFFKENKNIAKDLFENMIYYSMIIVLPIMIGIIFIGGRILEFVYKFNSPESILAFQILSLALVFIYLSSIMGYLIAAADKQIIFAWIGGIGALINITINFILIPKYSLYGAGSATVFTYFIMSTLMFIYIRKNFFKFKFRIIQPLIATIIMGLVLSQILHLHLFLIIGISGMVYKVTLVGFNYRGVLNYFKKINFII
jgi:O-antigen/teichoic acid export membrane protein